MKHAFAYGRLRLSRAAIPRLFLVGVLLLSRGLSASLAFGAEPAKPVVDDAQKAEAARRFERGLKLFDTNDTAGALAEFKRTYEIMPNPTVLYNIGLVYAAMGRPVESVDALESAVASGSLSPDQLERSQTTLLDQKARVGRLLVTTTPEGARIEIDNVLVAKTPLTHPLRISEGSHIVGAVAEGFAPARKEVLVAGNAEVSLRLDLVPTQGKRLANLNISTSTVGAEVLVDGQATGKTPLSTSITLVAGHHRVELRRPGYVTAHQEVDVGEGATGDLTFQLAVDAAALEAEGATLLVDASESNVELSVDGERKGEFSAPLRLPRGSHRITVSKAGFIPLERQVTLDAAQTNVVRVVLEPTPETREKYRSSANFHRTWGWIGIASGVLIAGGGTTLSVLSSSDKSAANSELAKYQSLYDSSQAPCDWRGGYLPDGKAACVKLQADAQSKLDSAQTLSTLGYVGIGVGGAVAISGFVLLVTGQDPDRYEHSGAKASAASPSRRLALVPGPGNKIGYGLRVAF